jgi:hypothetical protein
LLVFARHFGVPSLTTSPAKVQFVSQSQRKAQTLEPSATTRSPAWDIVLIIVQNQGCFPISTQTSKHGNSVSKILHTLSTFFFLTTQIATMLIFQAKQLVDHGR